MTPKFVFADCRSTPTLFYKCGWGTRWGCGRAIYEDAHILLNGRAKSRSDDDGHVLFHAACSPAVVEPDAVRRWSGTWTARREAERISTQPTKGKVKRGRQ